tara:strand:+ start:2747 stop:3061 length:315 start_codon:yes stop_codon:yes gene_type:complete
LFKNSKLFIIEYKYSKIYLFDMNNNKLKKKIIYRSNYRGSKEMDLLISSFVKKIINSINEKQLIQLNELVNLDDETLFRLNREPNINQKKKTNEIVKLFQKYKI